jgi:hypothetical protein
MTGNPREASETLRINAQGGILLPLMRLATMSRSSGSAKTRTRRGGEFRLTRPQERFAKTPDS